MKRLPLTVIGGYLGAGKTTLINRLLREPHGKRIMVLVNDFGAINIDASLLESHDEDTITLNNGCVCCTMGADLFMALGDALDRQPRPDHLIIEASGIGDPARIAEAARSEPELSYAGIVTMVDALNFPSLSQDTKIGPQVTAQVRVADLVLITKAGLGAADLIPALSLAGAHRAQILKADAQMAELILGELEPSFPQVRSAPHPSYARWHYDDLRTFSRAELEDRLAALPEGLYRLKGYLRGQDDQGWLLQIAGKNREITRTAQPPRSQLVAIGPAGYFDPETAQQWWQPSGTAC